VERIQKLRKEKTEKGDIKTISRGRIHEENTGEGPYFPRRESFRKVKKELLKEVACEGGGTTPISDPKEKRGLRNDSLLRGPVGAEHTAYSTEL